MKLQLFKTVLESTNDVEDQANLVMSVVSCMTPFTRNTWTQTHCHCTNLRGPDGKDVWISEVAPPWLPQPAAPAQPGPDGTPKEPKRARTGRSQSCRRDMAKNDLLRDIQIGMVKVGRGPFSTDGANVAADPATHSCVVQGQRKVMENNPDVFGAMT